MALFGSPFINESRQKRAEKDKKPRRGNKWKREKKTQGEMRTHGLAVFCSTQGHTLEKDLGHPIIHILQ